MLKLFRVIAFFEGVSYILLLFIAVPIKYGFDDPTYVKLLGMPHGILFMIYIIFSFIVNKKLKWNRKELFIILIADKLGFFLAILIFTFVTPFLWQRKDKFFVLLYSVGMTVFVFVFFTLVLQLKFPQGILENFIVRTFY